MVDTHNIDSVVEMCQCIKYCSLAIFAEETIIERHLHHTTLSSQLSHLVVGEIARMVAKGSTAGVATHNGLLADVECIVETVLTSMTHIYHDAQFVHLPNDLLAEVAHTAMGIATAC